MKTGLKTEIQQENFEEFEAHEKVAIGMITNKEFYPFIAKSELTNVKTEVKSKVKEEHFEKYEAREQGGIDLITNKDFDHPLAKLELIKSEVKSEKH